jgi:hypothetical protein
MRRFVAKLVVGLGLNNHPRAPVPNQLTANKIPRTAQRIAPKKIRLNYFAH